MNEHICRNCGKEMELVPFWCAGREYVAMYCEDCHTVAWIETKRAWTEVKHD